MKRYALFFIICLIVGTINSAFAAEGNISQLGNVTSTVDLNAKVLPYASVCWKDDGTLLQFSGTPNQRLAGNVTVIVESNCAINSVLTGTPFTNGIYTLATDSQQPFNSRWHRIDNEWIPFVNSPMGVKIIPVSFRATTGSHISSQAAGSYIGSLTFIVYQAY